MSLLRHYISFHISPTNALSTLAGSGDSESHTRVMACVILFDLDPTTPRAVYNFWNPSRFVARLEGGILYGKAVLFDRGEDAM